MTDRIIILGTGPGWQNAPTDIETWSIINMVFHREASLLFEMHRLTDDEYLKLKNVREAVEKANELNIPIMTLEMVDIVRHCNVYPIKEIIKAYKSDYFTNSISYMIAYALFIGIKRIDIYGVAMVVGSEYAIQKPSVEYWIAYARGKGVKVNVHGFTELLKSADKKLYGYNTEQKGVGQDIGTWFADVDKIRRENFG